MISIPEQFWDLIGSTVFTGIMGNIIILITLMSVFVMFINIFIELYVLKSNFLIYNISYEIHDSSPLIFIKKM